MIMSLRSEILEQPAVLENLLQSQREHVGEIARTIRGRGVHSIFLAARGTSDNAGLYAKYLWGSTNRLPVALAAPSLFTIYRTPPDLTGQLVVGISQSGQSPDMVSVVVEGRRQGALTLAITNDATSPLAAEAEMVLEIGAGTESAVAATKTYTGELLAIAMLSAALCDDERLFEALERLPALVAETLELESVIEGAAQRYRYMDQCVVIGRGYNYATAYEWALKLKELTYVVADPYSPADFQHGPIAIVSQGFPVLAAVPRGAVFDDALSLLTKLVNDRGAELLAVSNEQRALSLARTPLALPDDLPEWLSPLVAIVPAQIFCYHLTRAKGYDTEAPRQLVKVTRTW
jgi:glucosamine--fructose-6-phosphate aminotransferase (isomerizing)